MGALWLRRLAVDFFGQEQSRQIHIRRLGDLDVAIATLHHRHIDFFQPLHQARFVGTGEAIALSCFERAR